MPALDSGMNDGFRSIDSSEVQGREAYFLITSLVVPRPIAWVSSLSTAGVVNLAPHSFFNVISSNPLIVHFTSTGEKDTLRNVRSTREFVVNIVNRDLAESMNLTAADFPPDVGEMEATGLRTAASTRIAPPRVADAPGALECTVEDIVSKGDGHMVFGRVLVVHVADHVFRDGRIAPELLRPVGRLAGSQYSDAAASVFELRRPKWGEISARSDEGAGSAPRAKED